jgi:hypothetical protein
MKRMIGSLLAVVVAGSLVAASSARNSGEHSTLRSGTLHVKKECSEYTGEPGGLFCTVYSSNLKVIAVGSKIVYATADPEETDLTLYSKGAKAFGHVIINPDTGIGTVTFSGGTGPLKRFKADLVVRPIGDPAKTLYWRWDGKYSY